MLLSSTLPLPSKASLKHGCGPHRRARRSGVGWETGVTRRRVQVAQSSYLYPRVMRHLLGRSTNSSGAAKSLASA